MIFYSMMLINISCTIYHVKNGAKVVEKCRKNVLKNCNVRLKNVKNYCIVVLIGNEIKADVSVTFNSSTFVERLEVVFI